MMKTQILLYLTGISMFSLLLSCKSTGKESPAGINNRFNQYILFVGTYTSGSGTSKSEGIYVYRVDLDSMKFERLHAIKASNPSYLCLSPDKKLLFSVNENSPGQVSAFRIDSAYMLTFINAVPSQGSYPCYISVEPTEKYALVANYGTGSFAMLGINADGSLTPALSVIQDKGKGPNTTRQEGPHAHMITPNPFNGKIYATDLGTDRVHIFAIDTLHKQLMSATTSYSTIPGAGPRHLAIYPNGQWMYILSELTGTIEVAHIDPHQGNLERIQTISTLDSSETRYPGSADIHITPNGKYLYATNRGDINNIACFVIDPQSGLLSLKGHIPSGGRTPRNFCLDPSGRYLLVANQDSNNIVVFTIQNDGMLKAVHTFNVPMPVCLKFL
ncbi:MAG: lactonase family protein [Bacteroidales bacterium]